MNINLKLLPRQSEAWAYLMDDHTTEVLFGSGAGSGKSFLGCLWVTTMCMRNPSVRYLIGRTVLQQLRLTTLQTLFEVFKMCRIKQQVHFTYNQQTGVIEFKNGSTIILKDLQHNPSDPMFDSLGGLELTGAFIDEASQIHSLAYQIIKSRLRYKHNQLKLQPKLFMTCNPGQNFLKREFYLPWAQGTLEEHKKFIRATAMDNPHLPKSYIETLSRLPEEQRERLLMGNWDYSQDINCLFEYDLIARSLHCHDIDEDERRHMTVDVARFGDDSSVICVWVGWCVVEFQQHKKLDTLQLAERIRACAAAHKIHPRDILIDADGVGGGVTDLVKARGFVNNSTPLNGENYANLKSQCYYRLSQAFKNGEISLNILNTHIIEELTQELLSVKLKDVDKDTKIRVQSKEEIKKTLGRSPDLADALMMGMWYKINALKTTGRYSISIL